MENNDLILEAALEYGKSRHPDAPIEHHAAFANAISFAVTNMSGGYGGPSMREHLASRLIISKFGAGANRCTFEQATELLDDCCYGKLTLQHAHMLIDEYCFGDAPGEIEAAFGLLATTAV